MTSLSFFRGRERLVAAEELPPQEGPLPQGVGQVLGSADQESRQEQHAPRRQPTSRTCGRAVARSNSDQPAGASDVSAPLFLRTGISPLLRPEDQLSTKKIIKIRDPRKSQRGVDPKSEKK